MYMCYIYYIIMINPIYMMCSTYAPSVMVGSTATRTFRFAFDRHGETFRNKSCRGTKYTMKDISNLIFVMPFC